MRTVRAAVDIIISFLTLRLSPSVWLKDDQLFESHTSFGLFWTLWYYSIINIEAPQFKFYGHYGHYAACLPSVHIGTRRHRAPQLHDEAIHQ